MGSTQKSSGKGKFNHVKANWTPENHEVFIDLCLEQISLGNRPGTHLNREGWRNILDSFQTITGLKYDKTQLKNHWDGTKKHWMVWHKLISTERMKWDPNTRTFGASEQEWDDYLGVHTYTSLFPLWQNFKNGPEKPEAAPFRLKELLFAEKLDIVFDGTVNLGQTNRPYNTPRKNTNWLTAEDPTSRRRKQDNKANENENQERFKKHQHGLTNTVFPVEELIGARLDGGNFERCCYDAGESRSVITVQSPPSKLSYSIEECIKCLDSIEELEQGSEVYLFALDIFLKKEYREIFLNLKKTSTKIVWLERLRSVGPPLPLH